MAAPLVAAAAAASPVTSTDTTRTVALACIVAGTVMFLVFVAYKMQQRVSCSSCSAKDPAVAQRAALLGVARQLYRAAGAASDPGSFPRERFMMPAGWRAAHPPAFPPPTLAPEEVGAVRSPRSPAEAAAHLVALSAGSPWSLASEMQLPPRSLSPPLLASPAGLLGATLDAALRTSTAATAAGMAASTAGAIAASSSSGAGASASSSPSGTVESRPRRLSRWNSVRELVHMFSGASEKSSKSFVSRQGGTAAGERGGDSIGAADVLVREAPVDLESQQTEVASQSPEARALTWSQLGIASSPAGSRRTSDTSGQPPLAHAKTSVCSNPMFSMPSFSEPGNGVPAAGSVSAAAAAVAAAAAAAGGSFSQVRRLPSRLARALSSGSDQPRDTVEPSPPAVPPAASVLRSVAGEGSAHAHWELSSHSRGGSTLWNGLQQRQSGSTWAAAQVQGTGMRSRTSRESLMHSQAEPEGLQRINEDG